MHREKVSIPDDCWIPSLSRRCTLLSSNWLFWCSEDAHLRNVKHGCTAMESTATSETNGSSISMQGKSSKMKALLSWRRLRMLASTMRITKITEIILVIGCKRVGKRELAQFSSYKHSCPSKIAVFTITLGYLHCCCSWMEFHVQ